MGREPAQPAPRPASVDVPPPGGRPAAPRGEPRRPAAGPDPAPAGLDPARIAGWVEAARGGDPAAFDALVHAYGPLLYRVIGRLVSDPDDRDDVVQDTFVRAFEALGRFRPGADFRPWLLTIGLNLVRDRLRRRRRAPALASLEDGEGDPLPLAAADPGPLARVVGEDLRARAEAAFARLDPDAQAILWLRVREGLEYGEIAEVLGIPRGTVMSRLSRARDALRAELEP